MSLPCVGKSYSEQLVQESGRPSSMVRAVALYTSF